MTNRAMLTTLDNPWNPFTHFTEWNAYDAEAGYNTTPLLARVAVTSDEMSDIDQQLAYDRAVEEIARENVTGNYRLVYEDSLEPLKT